jgi:RimJ/RimL family protein N-acetyltransferase
VSAAEVRRRYLEVNGEHPMTAEDDAYVRQHFVPASDDQLALMAAGLVPLPSYLLADGTPMVPADHLTLAEWAGGPERLHDWFVAFWPDDPATAEDEWAAYLSGQYVCLRRVDPGSIRRKTVMVEQARAAVAALRVDPRDHLARGSLGEAVDGGLGVPGLDELLRPMTAYDRLRFGGPSVRDTWVDAVREEFFSPRPPALPLRTERLVLRRAVPEDAAVMAPAYADPDFMRYLLVGQLNPAEVAMMVRRRAEPADDGPHRALGLVVEHEGAVVGDVVLFLQGTGLQQAEIGWTVLPEAAGHGYGTEAARRVLAVAFEHYGVRRVVANLDALNDRSAAMAERLGMRRESHRIGDFWSKGRWTDSFDYAILVDEWRAGR